MNIFKNRATDGLSRLRYAQARVKAKYIPPTNLAFVVNNTEATAAILQRRRRYAMLVASNSGMSMLLGRLKQLAFNLQFTEAVEMAIDVIIGTIDLSFSISAEAEMQFKMERIRAVLLAVQEALSFEPIDVARSRSANFLISENENVEITLERLRGVAFAIAQLEDLTLALGRVVDVSLVVALEEEINIRLNRFRDIVTDISSTLTVNVSLNRLRKIRFELGELLNAEMDIDVGKRFSVLIDQTELIDWALSVDKVFAASVEEQISFYIELKRIRGLVFDLIEEHQEMTFNLDYNTLVKLAFSISEQMTQTMTLNRVIALALLFFTSENIVAEFIRVRGLAITIEEQEAISVLLELHKRLHLEIESFEDVSIMIERLLTMNLEISQEELVAFELQRRREFTASIIEQLNMGIDVNVYRGIAFQIDEDYDVLLQAIQRVRNMAVVVVENSELKLDFGRIRGLVQEIFETQGVTFGTIRRVRGIMTDIAQTSSMTITLTIYEFTDGKFTITAVFNTWENGPNGEFNMKTDSLTWEVAIVAPIQVLELQEPLVLVSGVPPSFPGE